MFEQLTLLYADRPELKGRRKEYATYSAAWLTLAASANGSEQTIVIGADADFVGVLGTRVVTSADESTNQAYAPITAMIRDAGSGINVTDKVAALDNLFGTAQLPMVWPYAKLFKKQTTITIALDNKVATAWNVRITLHGFKLY